MAETVGQARGLRRVGARPRLIPTCATVFALFVSLTVSNSITQAEADGQQVTSSVQLVQDLANLALLAGIVASIVISRRNKRARG